MSSRQISILPPEAGFESAWRGLFESYAEFYRQPMTEDRAALVWSWINDPDHVVEARLAVADGQPVGFMHFRAMPRPLWGRDLGFLDDLYVAPEERGQGIGGALIEALGDIARERGWRRVQWITAEDNKTARVLYDRLAEATHWVTYDLKV